MTYKQFLTALRKTPRQWKIIDGGIRYRETSRLHCPLSKVAGVYYCDVWTAQDVLKMDRDLRVRIMKAADGGTSTIRRDLLKACGLTERP